MTHITNPKIFPQKAYKFTPRLRAVIVDSLANKNLSIILTNYNIQDSTYDTATVKRGQYERILRSFAFINTIDDEKHFDYLVNSIYDQIQTYMYAYPDHYINISTNISGYNINYEKIHVVREPDTDIYYNMDYL
jgi:hypothetical protein